MIVERHNNVVDGGFQCIVLESNTDNHLVVAQVVIQDVWVHKLHQAYHLLDTQSGKQSVYHRDLQQGYLQND